MKKTIILLLLVVPMLSYGSKKKFLKDKNAGIFSLGMRSTVSAFNHGRKDGAGFGYGAHFRLQFSDRVNSEWFGDYITADVNNQVLRRDAHVGWSVMYYIIDTKDFQRKVTPYVLAGHCFDYTKLRDYNGLVEPKDRWSAAVQAGMGAHFNITPKFDVTVTAQYMMHLGKHLEVHFDDGSHQPNTAGYVSADSHNHSGISFDSHKGGGVEGHLLINVSVNYKIADLW